MKTALVSLKSTGPYSQSRPHGAEKLDGELMDDYDRRTWREHAHCDESGRVFIPPMCFKYALSAAAKYLGMQIPGQGKKTWTKKFDSGVMMVSPVVLPITKDQLIEERIYANTDGIRGSNKRCFRSFPVIKSWSGDLEIVILDEIIKEDVLMSHLDAAGKFIGIGRFRPEKGGYLGRFTAEKVQWV